MISRRRCRSPSRGKPARGGTILAGRAGERDELDGLIACRVREIVPHNRAALEWAREPFLRLRKDRRRVRLNSSGLASYGLAKTGPNPFLFKDSDGARLDGSIAGPPA